MNEARTVPGYYLLPEGLGRCEDLTDLFVLRYGARLVAYHLLMEQEQYVWRSVHKGTFLTDQRKIGTLAARLRALLAVYPDLLAETPMPTSTPAMALDEMATILSASGHLVREQGLSDADLHRIATQHGYRLVLDEGETRPQTIADRAASIWGDRHGGEPLTRDAGLLFASDLQRHGFQADWHYEPHASQCIRLLPEWFGPASPGEGRQGENV